ncbi:MAG TPA: hypothetical protein VFE58_12745 [Tepidisphaeraceae bacterium]|jgi:hypothetical protein|nr:hypothetical protein [Tepidisphaeraceae bacterium]
MYSVQLLALLVLITAGGLTWQIHARRKRSEQLRLLSESERMNYSRQDRFGFAARVARHFPVPGVADVRVSDLLYRSNDREQRYVFTVDYTRGVLGAKRRLRSVAIMTESSELGASAVVQLAEHKGTAVEQYRVLLGQRE